MSFIGGYQSDVNLNTIPFVGNFPIEHSIGGFGIAIGLAGNYSLTLNPPISQYRIGLPLAVLFSHSHGGFVTLNVDGQGAMPIKKFFNNSLMDPEAGDISTNKIYLLVFDGHVFQLLNVQTLPFASELIAGMASIATQAEVNAGLNSSKMVVPLKLMTILNALLKHQAGAGSNSIIPKLGVGNSAPGSHAVVIAGNNNRANNTFSTAMGSFADAWQFNEFAKSPGAFFNTQGSVQHSVLTLWNTVPSGGGIFPINLDGAGAGTSNRWRVPNNTIIQFMLQFSIIQNSGTPGNIGDSWTAIFEGVAKNVNGVLTWVGGAPAAREIRQDAGLSPAVSFGISGNEIIPIVISIANKNLHVNSTAYITQTKFNLS